VEIAALVVGPQSLPQSKHVGPLKFSLVPNQKHAEKEEEICRVSRLKMKVEFGVHELYEVVECCELLAHAGLVSQEVTLLRTYQCAAGNYHRAAYHSVHESYKAPERDSVVLHDSVNGREKVAHALYVSEILVVLVVR
jgi:hypothetical protein